MISVIIKEPAVNPIYMLRLWRTSSDHVKTQLRNDYIMAWMQEHQYIPYLNEIELNKIKDLHWLYWWKTIDLLDATRASIYLDKWLNAINRMRSVKDVLKERMLLKHLKYWIWPIEEEYFFCLLAEKLVEDYVNYVETYDNGPYKYNRIYPGSGAAKSTWKQEISYLISCTYQFPNTDLGQKLQTLLWIISDLYTDTLYPTINNTYPIYLTWLTNHPDIWQEIQVNNLTAMDAVKLINNVNV